MKTNFNRRSFSPSDLTSVQSFVKSHPWSKDLESSLVTRFLTDLVSSNEMIFDLFEGDERVMTAALVDAIENAANSANLEIVGINKGPQNEMLFNELFNLAKKVLPASKNSIDISFDQTLPITEENLLQNGFRPAYSMYGLIKTSPVSTEKILPSTEFTLSKLIEADYEKYHSVVKKAFEKNEDTNVPLLSEMRMQLLIADVSPVVLKMNNKIIGFYHLKIDEDDTSVGTVNILGLLSEYRGKGFGSVLLNEALKELTDLNVKTYKLSVAAHNEKALQLYLDYGFLIEEKSVVYRWRNS